jgi:hypothetical protein
MHEGIPVFPFVPDAIKESRFFVIEAGDLKTEAEVANLIQQMWRQPEADFYYFFGHAGGPTADGAMLAARQRGDILMNESERRYYKHPKFLATTSVSFRTETTTVGIGNAKSSRRALSSGAFA